MASYTKTNFDKFVITTSDGNKKLVPNKYVKYIIWNLPAQKTCPFATPMCLISCYAMKSERAYPSARACRSANYEASKEPGFVKAMIEHINKIINRPSYLKAKKIVVRIHESGDIYSQEYFNKWLAISDHFKENKKLVFVAYTKSLPYIHDIPINMVIRSSIWDDTADDMRQLTEALRLPVYTAVENFTDEPQRKKCDCVNCSTCFKCFNAKFSLLKCEIH